MPKIEIPTELPSLDEVPDQFKSLYVEKDGGGGYVYKDPKAAIEGMRRAKEERGTALEELSTLKSQFKDIDPKRYKELVEKESTFKEVESANKGELEKIKNELKSNYEGQISERDKKIIDANARYANRILDGDVAAALAQAGATEKGVKLLTKVMKGDVTTQWENDEPVFVILDPKTNKPKLNKEADRMSLVDLAKEMRESYPELFGSSAGSGGGAGAGDKNVAAPTDESPSTWSEEQKQAWIKANGHEAYRNLVVKESARRAEERQQKQRKSA
jgi:hypothetical protein